MHFVAHLVKTPQNKYSGPPLPIKGHAMIDSGTSSCFISKELVKSHKLHTYRLGTPKKLNVIDRQEISSRRVEEACDLEFVINNHKEIPSGFVVDLGLHHVVLGMSWLKKHTPLIDWKKDTVSFTSSYCDSNCLTSPTSIPVNEANPEFKITAISGLPEEYQDFMYVFTEDEEVPLPPHRPYDLAIELEPGSKPKWGPLYNLGQKEDDKLKTSLERWIRQGYVRVSKSPMASPILFVK